MVRSTSKFPKIKGAPNTKAEFLKLFVRFNGNRNKALEKIGVKRDAYFKWMRDPVFKESYEHVKDGLIDNAEALVHREIKGKNLDAAMFLLERLGKDRGWQKTTLVKAEVTVHAADVIKHVHEKRMNTNPSTKETPSER